MVCDVVSTVYSYHMDAPVSEVAGERGEPANLSNLQQAQLPKTQSSATSPPAGFYKLSALHALPATSDQPSWKATSCITGCNVLLLSMLATKQATEKKARPVLGLSLHLLVCVTPEAASEKREKHYLSKAFEIR